MHSFNIRAIVLKNSLYKDSDKIYTFFSKEKGKISAVAKGVRKITSRRSGNLDTLNVIDVKINPHNSGIYYISEVKGVLAFASLKQNYDSLKRGFYIAELVLRMTKEDEAVIRIYNLIENTLISLEKLEEDPRVIVNKFEIKFMQLLGYQPPSKLLLSWRDALRNKDFLAADKFMKNFVLEIVGEKIKSLDLD